MSSAWHTAKCDGFVHACVHTLMCLRRLAHSLPLLTVRRSGPSRGCLGSRSMLTHYLCSLFAGAAHPVGVWVPVQHRHETSSVRWVRAGMDLALHPDDPNAGSRQACGRVVGCVHIVLAIGRGRSRRAPTITRLPSRCQDQEADMKRTDNPLRLSLTRQYKPCISVPCSLICALGAPLHNRHFHH